MIPDKLIDKLKWNPDAGLTLRAYRKANKKSMRMIAQSLGCSQAYILDIEKAKNNSIALHTLKSLCDAIPVDFETFVVDLLRISG